MSNRINRSMVLAFAVTSAMAAASLSQVARAATLDQWATPGVNTVWNNASNWNSGIPANNTTDNIAEFAGTIAHQPNAGTTSIAGIQIGDGSTATTTVTLSGTQLTIGGSGISMLAGTANSSISSPITLDADQSWVNSSAASLTVGTGAVTGGGHNLVLTNSGTGTAILTTSGAMTGLNNLTLNNINTGTGVLNVTGSVNGSGTLTISNNAAAAGTTMTFSGSISGFSAVNISGNTTSVLNITGAANTFTGTTTLSSGLVTLNKAVNLGNGGGVITGDLVINGGTVTNQFADMIADSSNLTVNSGGIYNLRSSGIFETVSNLTVNNGGLVTSGTGILVAPTGTITLAGNGTIATSNVVTGSGGLVLSDSSSATGRIVLEGDVSYATATSSGSTLGSVWLDGNRTFNVARGTAAADLTLTGATLDGTASSELIKTGAGIMKMVAPSSYSGGTWIKNGTLEAGATNSLPTQGLVTLGAAGTSGVLDVNANTIQIGGLANGAGAVAANQLVTNGGSTARVLTIDTTAVGSATFGGALQNGTPANGLALTKQGAGTQTLTGINTYSGATLVNRGTLEFVGQATNTIQTLGSIGFGVGDGNVKSTYNAANSGQVTGITFASLASRAVGSTGNFIVSGGVPGTTNQITITGKSGGLGGFYYYNGADFAFAGAGGVLRAPVYDTDAGYKTAGTSIVNSSTTNYLVNSTITGQGTATANTIKFGGPGSIDLSLASGAVLSVPTGGGILRSGGGSTVISDAGSGASLSGATNTEVVIRTDSVADSMTINVVVANAASGANALTKSGDGTLTLGRANTYAGKTFISGGTLVAANTQALGATLTAGVQLNGGTLDLATDSSIMPYNISLGSDSTILSDKATPSSDGITHTLGSLTLGAPVLTIDKGANVNDSNAAVAFGAATVAGTGAVATINNQLTQAVSLQSLSISGQTLIANGTGSNSIAIGQVNLGAGQSSTLFSKTANFQVTTVTGPATGTSGATLLLDGVNTGNAITGPITNGAAGAVVSLTKSGTGTWTLGGSNSYTGNTHINDGILSITGTLNNGAGTLDIGYASNGGPNPFTRPTLAGTGSIAGTGAISLHGGTSLLSTGHLMPGVNGAGTLHTLHLNNLTAVPGSNATFAPIFDFTFTSPGAADHSSVGVNTAVAVVGTLNLISASSGGQIINLLDGPTLASGPGAYQILTYGTAGTSVAVGDLTSLFTLTGFDGYHDLTVTNDGVGTGPNTGIWVNFSSFDGVATVPEPASLGLLGMGAAALLIRRRRAR